MVQQCSTELIVMKTTMPAEEKDSAATNRLLDLLRSQQTGKSTTEGNASGTVDTESSSDTTENDAVDPVVSQPSPSAVSSSIVPEPVAEDKQPKAAKDNPVSSEEIMKKLGNIGKKKEAAPEVDQSTSPDEIPVKTEPPPAKAAQGTAAALTEPPPAPAPEPEPEVPAVEEEIEAPEVIDPEIEQILSPEHFQVHKSVKPPNKALDLMFEFSNWALGIRKKITIQCTTDSVRIMKMISSGPRNIVQSMEEYMLPYETDDEKITHPEDLLAYLLDKLDPKLWKNDTMFRTYSSTIETQTKVFKAPPVKGKEINDLITWSAKKNLPFSSDNINIDFQILESLKDEVKKSIIIGVGNNESITHLSDLYKKRKFDLQTVTTIPYLDWQTFKHCYPDRQRGCIAIVHIGKNNTTLTIVKSGRLEFNREMAVGTKDYQKALVQRVMVGNDAVNITEEMAADYILRYGIPHESEEVIPETGISLYKIRIFLRPIVERMTKEINRSLNYFKKQVADVECQEIYMTGPGASIPNLVEEFTERLERSTEYLNPLRQGDFEFSDEMGLDYQQIPIFASNFALALKKADGINLLPIQRKQHFQYRIFNKLSMFVAAILLPLYLILGYFSYLETGFLEESVAGMNEQWQRLSEQSQEYFVMLDDLEHLSNYWGYLSNDRINSQNQVKLLRLLSSEIPDNIRVTSLVFRPASTKESGKTIKQDAHVDRIALSGFVHAHAGIADIQLTNFIMRLESLNMFTSIERETQGTPSSDDTRLLFTLKMGVGI